MKEMIGVIINRMLLLAIPGELQRINAIRHRTFFREIHFI
jgi:hypothetical protein